MTKVLIIEGDEDTRYLYQIALKFQRFDIITANSATEGLAKIIAEKPALVLLDVFVSDLGESHFLEGLRNSTNKEIPVIILTDLRDGAASKEAAVYGACEYVNKNESVGDIITSVRKALKD